MSRGLFSIPLRLPSIAALAPGVFLLWAHLAIAAGASKAPLASNLNHLPLQPKSGQPVIVFGQIAAPEGMQSVTLQVQVVEPGKFIRKADPAYAQLWQDFPMNDEGKNGDLRAGDNIFTATVPGEFQKHRNLIRYRMATKKSGNDGFLQWPPATNASPNLAWFTYDRIPAWSGASLPNRTGAISFSSQFLSTLPACHLVAREEDVNRSQWDQSANRQPFSGALVWEGRVYDHITYHNRGQASTYVAGKNKWGFKFNNGQEFAAQDFYGRSYKFPWTSLELNPCASAWAPVNRGMAGMDEAVSYRAYQLAGVPSPDTRWVQLRVVDRAEETSPRSQYDGDLWGLYLSVQSKNGTWLRENGMADGNLFSAESGPKHFAKGMPTNGVDLAKFMSSSSRGQPEAWWRGHLDLPSYYGFHAMNRVLANIDLRQQGNHYIYHRPDEHWVVLPHDLDMMFIPKTHWPGIVEQARCLDVPALSLEYKNRAREILDLFCADPTPAGGQIGQLVAELAQALCPKGETNNWAQLDEAMWNGHPRSNHRGQFYVVRYPDSRMGGSWVRKLASPDFAGFCKYIVDFCTDSRLIKNYRENDGNQVGYGYGFLWSESKDDSIPNRPTLRYAGGAGFPANQLEFAVSSFVSPKSVNFAAFQWRVAEIGTPPSGADGQKAKWRYELESGWSSGELNSAPTALRVPAGICKGSHVYRARARYKDATGRWSRWSEPVQFTAKAD